MSAEFLSSEAFAAKLAALKQECVPVLDGSIQLIDVMGHEREICEAARVTAQTTAKLPAEDVGLMRYLLRHRHTTPFEMVEMKFRVTVAMDTWRQWIRHRMANVNEYSTRYSPAIDECQRTGVDSWRLQSTSNRQGSAGELGDNWPANYRIFPIDEDGQPGVLVTEEDRADERRWGVFRFNNTEAADTFEFAQSALVFEYVGYYSDITPGRYLTHRETEGLDESRGIYEERLAFGVAKEQARKDLPLSTMTTAIWKCDMHNLLHFLSLRMDSHAQLEIRTYANAIGAIVGQLYPVLWEAFKQYRLNAMTLTELDIAVIQNLVPLVDGHGGVTEAMFLQACPPEWGGARSRERDECLAKLQKLGLVYKAA
jgi:thymidylate synthase (FAD)